MVFGNWNGNLVSFQFLSIPVCPFIMPCTCISDEISSIWATLLLTLHFSELQSNMLGLQCLCGDELVPPNPMVIAAEKWYCRGLLMPLGLDYHAESERAIHQIIQAAHFCLTFLHHMVSAAALGHRPYTGDMLAVQSKFTTTTSTSIPLFMSLWLLLTQLMSLWPSDFLIVC